jgi:DNA-binding NarL/FixJ family response regulator
MIGMPDTDISTVAYLDRPRRRLALVGSASAPPQMVRVAIACGSTLVCAAFRALLESQGDFAVAGEATTSEDAVELTRRTRPTVILIAADLPGLDVVDAIERIAGEPRVPAVKVIALGGSGGQDRAVAALRAGATGFLALDTGPAELVRAVRLVARGEAFLSPDVMRSLIEELAGQPGPSLPNPEQLDELTAREREVMALAATGLNNDEIGQHLMVSPATARTHVSRAMMKLCAHDRAQLVALAYTTGLVHPRKRRAFAASPALALA